MGGEGSEYALHEVLKYILESQFLKIISVISTELLKKKKEKEERK